VRVLGERVVETATDLAADRHRNVGIFQLGVQQKRQRMAGSQGVGVRMLMGRDEDVAFAGEHLE
jgi:hypothetical protein